MTNVGIVTGTRVTVSTIYTIKRGAPNPDNPKAIVAVEDAYGDRVLSFRQEELTVIEESIERQLGK